MPPNLPVPVLTATQNALAPANLPAASSVPSPVKWTSVPAAQSSSDAPILTLNLPSSPEPPKQLVWHRKGDYVASVCTCIDRVTIMSKLIYHHSGRPGRRMDPPGVEATFTGAVQESQGRGAARSLPPVKTALLRRSTFRSPIYPLDRMLRLRWLLLLPSTNRSGAS